MNHLRYLCQPAMALPSSPSGREAARAEATTPGGCACRLAIEKVFSCRCKGIGCPPDQSCAITEPNF